MQQLNRAIYDNLCHNCYMRKHAQASSHTLHITPVIPRNKHRYVILKTCLIPKRVFIKKLMVNTHFRHLLRFLSYEWDSHVHHVSWHKVAYENPVVMHNCVAPQYIAGRSSECFLKRRLPEKLQCNILCQNKTLYLRRVHTCKRSVQREQYTSFQGGVITTRVDSCLFTNLWQK